MKKSVVIIVALAVIASVTYTSAAEEEVKKDQTTAVSKAQTTCPIMGGAIDKKHFADFNGNRVYFCCGGCITTFNKEPGRYIKKLEDSGVTLEKTPVAAEKK